MENLNAEQIKKALECCSKANCVDCPYREDIYGITCGADMPKDALALINSQEWWIEQFEARLRHLLQSKTISEYDELNFHTKEYRKDIMSLDANIRNLNERNGLLEMGVKELTEENERLKGRNEHLAECLDIEDKYKDRLQGILLQFTDIVHKWGNKYGYDTTEISLVPVFYEANTIKSQIEADTVRKMQERLKKWFGDDLQRVYSNYNIHRYIDGIAKELLESDDG